MLQIKNIRKQYITGDLVQTALDDVSLNFRDNEFVAILGPSGSGKTTMLNIIGGLDRYDSGDLIINGISTKQYKDRDWDSYRNHTIGFVFQSYNLIPHQTVLANVELALTISGISKAERRKRAKAALEKVGLGKQTHKKPNQMSGGQMQRVAIARALVNDPAILLADEPTGALDSETSVQVMDMLKEVAKDRLVVMVTHNPELAYEYATRIVKVKDGKIQEDSMPFDAKDESQEARHENMGKSSMSLSTALGLSFNNLRTKLGRTLLTSFAGSIGIIGIALILSLSNGVSTYIDDLQKDTMTSYPISIESQSMDLTSLMQARKQQIEDMDEPPDHDMESVYSDSTNFEIASSVSVNIKENNLTGFKQYLDNSKSEIHDYIGENGIVYNYDTKFAVYTYDNNETLINTDGSNLEERQDSPMTMMSMMSGVYSMMGQTNNNFQELMPGVDGELISKTVTDNYDIVYGSLPRNYDEVVLILDFKNEIPQTALYQLGFLPAKEYREIMKQIEKGEEVHPNSTKWSYASMCNKTFYLVPECDMYIKNDDGLYERISQDDPKMDDVLKKAIRLKITGILRPKESSEASLIVYPVGYTNALTQHLIDYTNQSEVVKEQENQPEVNILNGMHFDVLSDNQKVKDTKDYIADLNISGKAQMYQSIMMIEQMLGKSHDSEEEEDDTTENPDPTTGFKSLSLPSFNDANFMEEFTMNYFPDEVGDMMEESIWETESEIWTEPETEEITESLQEEPTEEPTQPPEEVTEPPQEEPTEPPTEPTEPPTEEIQPTQPIDPTEPPSETLPDFTLPEIPDEVKQAVQERIESLQRIAEAQEEQRQENLKKLQRYLEQSAGKALDRVVDRLNPFSGMSQEEIIKLFMSQMAGQTGDMSGMGFDMSSLMSGLNTEDIMKAFMSQMGESGSTPFDMSSLMSGFSQSDLMNMLTGAATSSTPNLSALSSLLGGASGTPDLSSLMGSAGNNSDLMSKYMQAMGGASGMPDLSNMSQEDMMSMYTNMMDGMSQEDMMKMYSNMTGMSEEDMEKLMAMSQMSENELAVKLDEYMKDPDEDVLLEVYDRFISSGNYDSNMDSFGVISLEAPSSINIYVDSFEAKEKVEDCIKAYNETVPEEDQISYTDYVGLLMSSVTTIVDVISYILIAFVAVSLVVSSIMIGIITYISVLERTKEIGILRAIGASKHNISQVFNAETFIIGLCSGVIGVGLSELILIPANILIHYLADSDAVSAALPIVAAFVLVVISVGLTLIGGFIPAKKAATKDPVTALRSE
ncbi:MAG: ABC transporter ATP-binding protein/permease [Oscillospiraceae bacterium]